MGTRVEMMPFVPEKAKRVLEIGCGAGKFCEMVKTRNNAEAWGVEPCLEMADDAAGRLNKVIRATFDQAIKELPEHYFDCVIFNDVLEHLVHPKNVLTETKKLLADHGCVVASIPNIRHYGNLVRLLFFKDWKYLESGILDYTHVRFFTKKSIIRLFEESGYHIVKIKGINQVFNLKWMIYYLYSLGFGYDTRFAQFGCTAELKK